MSEGKSVSDEHSAPAVDVAAAPKQTTAVAQSDKAVATEVKPEPDTEPAAPAVTEISDPAPKDAASAPASEVAPPEKMAADGPAPADSTGEKKATAQPAMLQLFETAKAAGHPEVWGVTLEDPTRHVPSQIVLQKYLNANDGDLAKAQDQLTKTLKWRAKMKPLDLVKKTFSRTKFDGLGYVTAYGGTDPAEKDVFTWNVYGATKSMPETFGNLAEFIEWRVALMELALQELSLNAATTPITADHDPYKLFQVHDYKSISFLRSPPQVKTASSETIKVFAQNYPELLKEKFFVNVPAVMGFVYAFMKLFVAPKTIKKFHPMSNGAGLALEFSDAKVKGLGDMLPPEYGGKGKELKVQGKEPLLD